MLVQVLWGKPSSTIPNSLGVLQKGSREWCLPPLSPVCKFLGGLRKIPWMIVQLFDGKRGSVAKSGLSTPNHCKFYVNSWEVYARFLGGLFSCLTSCLSLGRFSSGAPEAIRENQAIRFARSKPLNLPEQGSKWCPKQSQNSLRSLMSETVTSLTCV